MALAPTRGRFDPTDWYWQIGDDLTRFFSSKTGGYVQPDDPALLAWLANDHRVSQIASETELWDILAERYPDGLPNVPEARNKGADFEWNSLPRGAKKLLFSHENRIRALEGKPALTLQQFIAAYRQMSSPS